MKLPPRPVVVVSVTGTIARCTIAPNGSTYTLGELVDLAQRAGLEPRRVRQAVLLPARALPTLEAAARVRRVILQRRKTSTTEDVPTFQPTARLGIETEAEPVHGCAREHCRTKGCHYGHRRTA